MTQPTVNPFSLTGTQQERLMQRLLQARRTASAVGTPPSIVALPASGRQALPPSSPTLDFEARPLDTLIKAGHLPKVQAAALAYWPDELLRAHGLAPKQVIEETFHHRPVVATIIETAWGRIAAIVLPRLHSELYVDPTLIEAISAAVELAGELGAHSVSLTGLLPSATAYGNKLLPALSHRQDLPHITTGHAMTAASVVLNIGKILEAAGRSLAQERVAFLGLGSIGLSTLRLLLQVAPHPQTLLLCDLFSKYEDLQSISTLLRQECHFQGDLQLIPVHHELPSAVYTASLIVGATNIPNVLDVWQLPPGVLLVDDSGPHCFDVQQAISRLTAQHDLLFTEGGAVQLPTPIRQLYHTPAQMATIFTEGNIINEQTIMGCVFSSLLSTPQLGLPPTCGPVAPTVSLAYYQASQRLALAAAPLHCGAYVLPDAAIARFRARNF